MSNDPSDSTVYDEIQAVVDSLGAPSPLLPEQGMLTFREAFLDAFNRSPLKWRNAVVCSVTQRQPDTLDEEKEVDITATRMCAEVYKRTNIGRAFAFDVCRQLDQQPSETPQFTEAVQEAVYQLMVPINVPAIRRTLKL